MSFTPKFRVTVKDGALPDDVEEFSSVGQVLQALNGGMVLMALEERQRFLKYIPSKVGEINISKIGRVSITLERIAL
jgi:hypothetical protein